MRKISFNKKYEKNIFDFKLINKENFILFKIKNFLDKENYKFIKKNFPKINEKDLVNFKLKKNNLKYSISSKDKKYLDILELNPNIKIIHKAFFSKKFFNFFFENLKKFFYQARKNDKIFLKKLKKGINLSYNSKNNSKTHIKRQIEFSYIFNNGKIVPHTDSRYKLLSLMLYFPDYKIGSKFYSKEKNAGTVFWNSKKRNLNNIHLDKPLKEKNFTKKNEKLTKIPFEGFHLYGFIRNDLSWHSVEKVNVNKKYVRKSININFYF